MAVPKRRRTKKVNNIRNNIRDFNEYNQDDLANKLLKNINNTKIRENLVKT